MKTNPQTPFLPDTPIPLSSAAIAVSGFVVRVQQECTSTNQVLLAEAQTSTLPSGTVLATELQTAGRGRRGRGWESPIGAGLTFSVLWRFKRPAVQLSGLSLAVGVAVVRTLRALGYAQVGLKWPNDIIVRDASAAGYAKLGGILVELVPSAAVQSSGAAAVIGIGVNVQRAPFGISLQALRDDGLIDRNDLLVRLLGQLSSMLGALDADGFAGLVPQWEALDLFAGYAVSLRENAADSASQTAQGIALGIAESGALRLQTNNGERQIVSGDLSLRPL